MVKKRKPRSHPKPTRPRHEELPWPGLKAEDHLSRVLTRVLKEAKKTSENEAWAENQIARVLSYVTPETAMRLLFREARHRRKSIPQFTPDWLELGNVILGLRYGLKELRSGPVRLTIRGVNSDENGVGKPLFSKNCQFELKWK